MDNMLKPRQVAKILNCSYAHVLELMRSNKIKAVDLAQPNAKKRMWRTTSENLNEFIQKGGVKC